VEGFEDLNTVVHTSVDIDTKDAVGIVVDWGMQKERADIDLDSGVDIVGNLVDIAICCKNE
jgi:hypothetical protein